MQIASTIEKYGKMEEMTVIHSVASLKDHKDLIGGKTNRYLESNIEISLYRHVVFLLLC